MSKTKTYRLYAMKMNGEAIKTALNQRFNRITPDYILIYTDVKQPENSVRMTDADASRMTEADLRWLMDCNVVVISEEAKKHETELSEHFSVKIDALEAALKAEKEKLARKEDAPNG